MPPHSVMFFPGSLRMRWCNPTSLATAWCMEDRFILRPHCLPRSLIHDIHRLVPYAPEHIPPSLRGWSLPPNGSRCGAGGCFDTASTVRCLRWRGFMRFLPRSGGRGCSATVSTASPTSIFSVNLSASRSLRQRGGRIILAHLGHGASMAALRDGKSVDTTMGFSPAGGLVMSTRTGDIDPGVLLFLIDEMGMSPGEVKEMVNRRSGLLGVSGSSDVHARPACCRVFRSCCPTGGGTVLLPGSKAGRCACRRAWGLDLLVFTGGIGEHSPDIRRRICSGLGFLGIALDEGCNGRNEAVISGCSASVRVMVMKTDEELMLARESLKLIESI